MKKLFFSLVAAMMAAMATYAQDVYVATLNHEGTISTFYGGSALTDAHDAAVDGDIITLSPGDFAIGKQQGTGGVYIKISKAITIRGAGMMNDTEDGNAATTVSGDTYITGEGMTIEGINFTQVTLNSVKNATFRKCKLKRGNRGYYIMTNTNFYDCIFTGFGTQNTCNNVVYNNCYINQTYTIYNSTMFNCIIYDTNNYSNSQTHNSNFTNCVIATYVALPATNNVANCLGINTKSTTSIFSLIPEMLNCNDVTTDIFNSWSDAIDNSNLSIESYQLSEQGLQYQGIDGTQIGMLGGNYPYNPVVSIPRITKCEVAEKATADNKLSVNIEVTAPTNK